MIALAVLVDRVAMVYNFGNPREEVEGWVAVFREVRRNKELA